MTLNRRAGLYADGHFLGCFTLIHWRSGFSYGQQPNIRRGTTPEQGDQDDDKAAEPEVRNKTAKLKTHCTWLLKSFSACRYWDYLRNFDFDIGDWALQD
jgi:hypothetical protein